MTVRESTVEWYLHRQVTLAGGTTRKFKGRRNDPDRIVIWPAHRLDDDNARIHFVECKAPGKKPRPGQVREHARLRALGCLVFVLDTKEIINAYVSRYR